MKCQQCEKPATFHITELTGSAPQELHFCEGCAKTYLLQNDGSEPGDSSEIVKVLGGQVKLGKAAEELAKLDQRACPKCGMTFYEFRNQGRLGCPHDYSFFERELVPLIMNIHGEAKHVGKRPRGEAPDIDAQTELIRLRKELDEAVKKEKYERASQLRDEIRLIQQRPLAAAGDKSAADLPPQSSAPNEGETGGSAED
jgi:protein arginine kinase activator